MNKPLSTSAVRMYTSCPKKYSLHYNYKLRSKYFSSALAFGSAVDNGLNELLLTKDLDKAIEKYYLTSTLQKINNIETYLPTHPDLVYAEADFDIELLEPQDFDNYKALKEQYGLSNESSLEVDVKHVIERKKQIGFKNLELMEKQLYNYANWLSLYRKGLLMIKAYYKKILPRIKRVIVVQKKNEISNSVGDKIVTYLDLIIDWEDNKRYLMDNKTSTRMYEADSAKKSQQLLLYYSIERDEYALDGVGFFVMYKQIRKNRIKICSVCGKNGTGGRYKKCDADIDGKRCNAEWNETIKPECEIDIILNEVPETAVNLVIETMDQANLGIKNKQFGPNLNACGSTTSDYRCAFYGYCWNNDSSDLIDIGAK